MREVERLVNLVVVYTIPPLPASSVVRTEVRTEKRVMGGYFEKSMAGFLENIVKDGDPSSRPPVVDGGDVRMNRIEVEQTSNLTKTESGAKHKRQQKRQARGARRNQASSPADSEFFIGISRISAINHSESEFSQAETSTGSLVDGPALTMVETSITGGCRPRAREEDPADDSNVCRGWFIHTPDPTRAVSKIIGQYNLFADISSKETKPDPPPTISGILQLGSDTRAVSNEEQLVSVDILSDKFRFCRHKAVDKIQVNLRDIRNAIPRKQLNSWGLIFSRVFSIYDFCNDNRCAPLPIIIRHLVLLGIEPALFMRSRVLGFYNQDVGALSLARDISYYAMLYGLAGLQLSYLVEYVEELIAEQSCDKGHVELYSTIKLLRVMSNPYMKSQGGANTNTSGRIYVYNERISINGLSVESGLSSKILSNLRQSLKAYNGYGRVRALYMIVSRYQSMDIHITFSTVEQLFKVEHISRKDAIAAVCLMERLRMAIPPRLMSTYKRIIKDISALFCSALNAALKRGESPNLYGVIRGVVSSNNPDGGQPFLKKREPHSAEHGSREDLSGPAGCGSPCNSYASERLIRDVTAVYIRRIRSSRNIRELEPIYGSILQFNELFGTAWSIEAELFQAVRTHAVRDAGGWPSGKFGEKIRQILSE